MSKKNISRKTRVINELGIHARPASKIARMTETACSAVWLHAGEDRADASSTLDILSLCAVKGTEIEVEIEDQADREIMNQIADFFEAGFGESEA